MILFGLRRTVQIFPVIESQLKEMVKMMKEVSSVEALL